MCLIWKGPKLRNECFSVARPDRHSSIDPKIREARMEPENPYTDQPSSLGASDAVEPTLNADGSVSMPGGMRRGKVGHVTVLGWLMVVQGIAELVVGVGLVVASFALPAAITPAVQNNEVFQSQGTDLTPEQLRVLITIVYGVMGAIGIVVGLLTIVGGARLTRFRSYVLGIVALSGGFFTIFAGCYCFPTALGLGIYGLVVLLNESVKSAFSLRKQGCSVAAIKAAFAGLPR